MKLPRMLLPVLLATASFLPVDAFAQTTLRVVMHSDLKILDPIWSGGYITRNHGYMINASCDKAMRGWPCDAEIERLRDQYARETNPAKQKAIAEAVQVRITQYPTHIHLGQWFQPPAARKNIEGFVAAPVTILWNVEKKGR